MAAVFFDIDGTLLDQEQKIEESAILAIRKLKENGHDVYINSGRTLVYINHPDLLALDFDGLLCGCGTDLYLKGEPFFYRKLEEEKMYRLIDAFNALDASIVIEGRDWLYMDEEKICRDPYGARLYHNMKAHIQPVAGNRNIEGSKFSCVITGIPEEELEATTKDFRRDFSMANHGGHVLEMTPSDCSKAVAIREICERTGVAREDTFAFGDGVNDVEMLHYAGMGIAMGNSRPPALEAADYITDDIHADGIRNALLHFGLI